MRLFDSNIQHTCHGNFTSVGKKIYLKYGGTYRSNFRGSKAFSIDLIARAPVGDGELSVTILFGEN